MNPGSVFFDQEFEFHDGEDGRKLFVVLGTKDGVSLVAKTTSQPHGRTREQGCLPADRFPSFYLPQGCCDLNGESWVCMDEFYELQSNVVLQKRFRNIIRHICDLDSHLASIQACALASEDITPYQAGLIQG